MIEGGATVITSCLQEQLKRSFIDQVIVTIAPTWVRGKSMIYLYARNSSAKHNIHDAQLGGLSSVQEDLPRNDTVNAQSTSGSQSFPTLCHLQAATLMDNVILYGNFSDQLDSNEIRSTTYVPRYL